MDLPINRALVVLLVQDQGGQHAHEGHGDRQDDHQKLIRTYPLEIHLTPPVDLRKN
jgi:hypothetical protein